MEQSNSELSQLNESIQTLNKSIAKSNSLKHAVLIGLLKGVSTALGATIVAAVVIAILGRSIKTLSDIPFVGSLIESSQVEKYIVK